MFKKFYRRFCYPTCKQMERYFRTLLIFVVTKLYPKFNSFRLFGLPAGWKTVESQTVLTFGEHPFKPPLTLEPFSHPNFEVDRLMGREEKIVLLSGGMQTEGAASLTASGHLVREFTEQFTMKGEHKHKLFTFKKERCRAKIPHFDVTVGSLVADCHSNYYHWLFDVLPKISLLQRAQLPISHYYAETSFGFQRDSLRLLGIDQIIPAQDNPIISASALALATFPCRKGVSKWICEYLREQFQPGKGKRRLFISRRDASVRRIINEEECAPILEHFGFETIVPGQLTFEEQVAHFREAEVILAPHGAGLSNIVFAPASAKVIEIYSPRSTCICFWSISNLLGMEYYYFRGVNDPSTYAASEPAHDHIRVDPSKLKSTLEMALRP